MNAPPVPGILHRNTRGAWVQEERDIYGNSPPRSNRREDMRERLEQVERAKIEKLNVHCKSLPGMNEQRGVQEPAKENEKTNIYADFPPGGKRQYALHERVAQNTNRSIYDGSPPLASKQKGVRERASEKEEIGLFGGRPHTDKEIPWHRVRSGELPPPARAVRELPQGPLQGMKDGIFEGRRSTPEKQRESLIEGKRERMRQAGLALDRELFEEQVRLRKRGVKVRFGPSPSLLPAIERDGQVLEYHMDRSCMTGQL